MGDAGIHTGRILSMAPQIGASIAFLRYAKHLIQLGGAVRAAPHTGAAPDAFSRAVPHCAILPPVHGAGAACFHTGWFHTVVAGYGIITQLYRIILLCRYCNDPAEKIIRL